MHLGYSLSHHRLKHVLTALFLIAINMYVQPSSSSLLNIYLQLSSSSILNMYLQPSSLSSQPRTYSLLPHRINHVLTALFLMAINMYLQPSSHHLNHILTAFFLIASTMYLQPSSSWLLTCTYSLLPRGY